jgi:hypothetical protein
MSRPDARPTAEDAGDPLRDRDERSAASAVASMFLRVAPGVLGVACIVVVARWVGAGDVAATLLSALPVLPLLITLEGARIPVEALATRMLLGDDRERVPPRVLFTAQFFWYALTVAMPGGRPVAEAWKATRLAPYCGSARAAAVAAACQASSFAGDALIASASAVSCYLIAGPTLLTYLIALVAGLAVLAAILLAALSRSDRVARLVGRVARFRHAAAAFREAARTQSMFDPRAVVLMVLARGLQVALFACALGVTTASTPVALALVLQALNMLGSIAGDLVPAQLGTTDAAFALAAGPLSAEPATMAAIAILFHAAQLAWVFFAGLAALWTFARGPRRESTEGV